MFLCNVVFEVSLAYHSYCREKHFVSVIHTFNGRDYDVVDERMTWPDAERYCFERGGHLTSIASAEENEFLRHFTTKAYNG